jgi:ABC-type antimicrobial peptide transport system permease subunit
LLAESLRRTVRGVHASVPVFDVMTMAEVRSYTTAGDRVWTLIFGGLGMVALLMTAVGLYGLLAFGVAERQREIGVRVALGARPIAVVRLVVVRALTLTVIGVVLGLAGAVAASRILVTLLYGVSGTLTPLIAVCATLLATSLVAAFVPARSAAKVDPMVALRAE